MTLLLMSLVSSGKYFAIDFKYFFLTVSILFCAFVSVLRYEIGGDYSHYVDEYNSIGQNGASSSYTEIGYSELSYLLYRLGFPAQSIFVISSFVLAAAIFYFVIKSVDTQYWSLFVLLFVILGFYFSSLNILRQYFATAFCIFGFVSLKRNRIFKFVLFVIIGGLFHTIVFVCLLLPLLMYLLKSRMGVIILLFLYIISVILVFVDIRPLVSLIINYIPRWSGYAESSFFVDRNNTAFLKILLPNFIFSMFVLNTVRQSQRNASLKKDIFDIIPINPLFISGMFCYILFQNVFYGVTVGTRLSEVFFALYISFLIDFMSLFNNKVVKSFFSAILVLYGILLTTITIFIMNGNGVVPYNSIML